LNYAPFLSRVISLLQKVLLKRIPKNPNSELKTHRLRRIN